MTSRNRRILSVTLFGFFLVIIASLVFFGRGIKAIADEFAVPMLCKFSEQRHNLAIHVFLAAGLGPYYSDEMLKDYPSLFVHSAPIWCAADAGNAEAIRLFLGYDGAKHLEYQCCMSGTPLDRAISRGHIEAAKELINAGAITSPYQLLSAKQSGSTELVSLLAKHQSITTELINELQERVARGARYEYTGDRTYALALAADLNHLALAYDLKDEHERAESLYLRSLAIRERHLAPSDDDLGKTRKNLLMLYRITKQIEKAQPLEQILADGTAP